MPAQHLWGMWELRKKYEWIVPPVSVDDISTGWVRRLLAMGLPLIGDVFQELYVLRRSRPGDIVYAADQQSSIGLTLLKALGLFSPQLVVTIHNGQQSPLARRWARAADMLIFLSDGVRRRTYEEVDPSRYRVLSFGPSLGGAFYEKAVARASEIEDRWDFCAAGKTNRDYAPLVDLANKYGMSGIIFDGALTIEIRDGAAEVRRTGRKRYRDVVAQMFVSKMVIIPLHDGDRLSGLTEICDAVVVGVPVVVVNSKVLSTEDYAGLVLVRDFSELERTLVDMKPQVSFADLKLHQGTPSMSLYAAAIEAVFDELHKDVDCDA